MSGSSSFVGPFNMARPFLFGFEYSRPECEGLNMEEDDALQNNLYRPLIVDGASRRSLKSIMMSIHWYVWPSDCPAI